MAEKKRRRTSRRAKANRRRAMIKRIIIAAAVILALLLAAACALLVTVPRDQLKATVRDMLGENLGAIRMMGAWNANAEKAYKLMDEKRSEAGEDAIAWFIHSDQHGRLVPVSKWVERKDKSVKSITLGDVVTDYFNEKELKAFHKMMAPVDNKICVYGNHDIVTKSDEQANYDDLFAWFEADGKKAQTTHGYFSVVDDTKRVKYLVISPYALDPQAGSSALSVKIGTQQMAWLLGEMGSADGCDIVILMHQLFTDTHTDRNGVQQTFADAPPILENLWNVMKDRENKRSGSITDSDGVVHTYDFTQTQTDILCSLHGHAHGELMLTEEGMTAYVSAWLGDEYNCSFALLDRDQNEMYIWRFDKTGVYDMLTLQI